MRNATAKAHHLVRRHPATVHRRRPGQRRHLVRGEASRFPPVVHRHGAVMDSSGHGQSQFAVIRYLPAQAQVWVRKPA